MKKVETALTLLLLLYASSVFSKPRWTKIQDQENVNYFNAVKQFDKYWEKHFLPSEDREGEEKREEKKKDPRPFVTRIFQSKKRAQEKSNLLAIDYKKFNKWKLEVIQYVKSDGSLMTTEERLEAWRQIKN